MNQSHDCFSEDDDDQALREMLSSLNSLSPPLETRLANRAAIADGLSRLAIKNQVRSLPWWSRSISVPLPIAAGLAALLVASFVLPYWASEPLRSAENEVRLAQAADEDSANLPLPLAVASGNRSATPVMEYYETEVYLCGIGRLSSESGYVIREQ